MSNATSLYAVDLEEVKKAIGANSAAIRDQVLATLSQPAVGGPFAVVNDDGGVTFNGVTMTPAAFDAEIRCPQWTGSRLRCRDDRTGRTPVHKAKKSVELNKILMAALTEGVISGLEWEQPAEEPDADELTLEKAIADLIEGTRSNDDEDQAYQYGYALEQLCAALGKHLGTIEGDELLTYLNLNTPLSTPRLPIDLPRTSDYPLISFLTEAEVVAEASRLKNSNFGNTGSPEIESGRQEYRDLVSRAAEQGKAVVAFYY